MIDIKDIIEKDVLDMKDVTEIAKQFIFELNGEQEQFQVEEIMLSEDRKNWLITVSYYRKIKSQNELQKTLGLEGSRVYKRIVIEREKYHVIGMFNWTYDRREAA
ncbi:MAG TPA: hypothetical protein VGB68_00275 [Pyrinomonadaceae bacterium]|jgi:hypothetical protein